jgi:hypothetical protein
MDTATKIKALKNLEQQASEFRKDLHISNPGLILGQIEHNIIPIFIIADGLGGANTVISPLYKSEKSEVPTNLTHHFNSEIEAGKFSEFYNSLTIREQTFKSLPEIVNMYKDNLDISKSEIERLEKKPKNIKERIIVAMGNLEFKNPSLST